MPRRSVPVEVARRRGNPGKRALPQPIRFAPLETVPEAPADLGPVEQDAWTAYATPLAEAGALQSIHLPLLKRLAVAVGLAERARAELEEGELCVRGSRGATLHPAFRGWSQAVALVARLSVEFGGSPAALTHIGLSQLRGKSPARTRREVSEGDLMAGALDVGGLVRVDPIRFIEGELRHTSDRWAGKPFHLRAFQRAFLRELFREQDGHRVYTRALWGLPRKNGKSEIAAAVGTKMLVADGTYGAEVISVAGDRAQARIVFDSAKRMVEFSPRLSATLRIFRDAIEDPGTDSVWRVMSADAPLKHGLRPSAVIFDEVHVQPSRELWDVLESGFGARTEPLLLGISTAGYDRASLLGDLVREGEEGKDPRFLYRWVGLPQNSEADYRSPRTWKLANPALSCADPFLIQARLVDMARRLPENQFRRLHLNQWTTGRDVAFADGVWEAASVTTPQHIPEGTKVVVAFVAARARDTVAIVGCTLEEPHVFPIKIWEETERVDPSEVADELRAVWARYNVHEFLCSEADWSWVLLMLAEEGLPITKVPRSPQRLALQWSQFYDAVLERRLAHDGDPVLARHVANLGLIEGPSGPRPDLDVGEGTPIASALGAMIAFDGVSRVERRPAPKIHVWQGRSEG